MKLKKRTYYLVGFLVIAFTVFGCVRGFYKYSPDSTNKKTEVKNSVHSQWKMMENNNHIVIHAGNDMYKIYSIKYDEETDSISALSKPFDGPPLDYYYKVIKKKGGVAHRKHRASKKSDIQQIHLFITGYERLNDNRIAFSKNDIFQVDASKDAVFLNALTTAGIVGGSVVAGGIGFLFIICGCPHVYVDNGGEMVYNNTLFTGAKAVQLERNDYKEIPDFDPTSESLSFQIVNEEKEDQYTNLVELTSIIHPSGVEVFSDKNGNLYSVSTLQAPVVAKEVNGVSVLDQINQRDEHTYNFDPDSTEGLSAIDIQFNNKEEGKQGKLLIRAKNTLWSGYVYDEFNSLFGKNHSKWVKMNQDKTKAEREKWMREQGIKLLVDIKVNGEWKVLDEVELVGEASLNQIVIPVDNDLVQKNLEFRIRTGYRFWELDYVGLDFSEQIELKVKQHKPAMALGNNGEDFVDELSNDDDLYMKHELKTELNKTHVVFDDLPVDSTKKRTLLLKSKGYYVPKSDYNGRTQRKKLQKFTDPGELSRFSRLLYDDVMQKMAAN